MMEVIKDNAKGDPEWSARCECAECKSILEVIVRDLLRFRLIGGGNETSGFVCPCCHQLNRLDVSKETFWLVEKHGLIPGNVPGTARIIARGK